MAVVSTDLQRTSTLRMRTHSLARVKLTLKRTQ